MIDQLGDALVYFVVFLLSTTLHEAGHAWAAMKGGDLTAYHGGQVSLDPIPHIRREPFGMVVLPLMSALLTGWPFGFASAPYDPHWAMQYPRRAALMALAGPAANLLLVIVAMIALRAGVAADVFHAPDRLSFGEVVDAEGTWFAVGRFVSVVFSLNLLLFVFNLLPFPPLDGSAAITLLMNRTTTARYQQFLWSSPLLGFIGLFVAWQLFDVVFVPVFFAVANLLYPGVTYG